MSFSRRQIVKGFSLGAGSLLLSPIVRRLEAHAAGDKTVAQKRFVFVVEGNGLNPHHVQPVGLNRKRRTSDRNSLIEQSLKNLQLPEALEPVAAFKDRLTIIQGLSGRICGGGHSNNFGAMGVYSSKAGAFGETIDAAIAKKLPSVFPRVGLGISNKPEHTVIYNCSALDKGKKLPIQCRPNLAYNALFGSVGEGAAKQEFQAKNNLLDFVIDDIKRLEPRLAGSERQKLGVYLESFESMRNRQSRLNEIQSTLRKHAPVADDKFSSDVETDRLDAHFDLAAAALISGLTNVVTLASGVGDPYFGVRFTGLGLNFGKHGIGHGGSYNGKTADQMAVMIRRFHFELIARLAKKLDAVPEGDGTMLDNTIIVYMSDAAEGHHSRCWEWPFVVLGNAEGMLRPGGRFVEYPYYGIKGHRTIANFYNTLLHIAGTPRPDFGIADPNLKHLDQTGTLSEVLV